MVAYDAVDDIHDMIAVVLVDAETQKQQSAAINPPHPVLNLWSLSGDSMSKSGNTDRLLGPIRETAGA